MVLKISKLQDGGILENKFQNGGHKISDEMVFLKYRTLITKHKI